MRPPTSRQDSSRTFNEPYGYDPSNVESGMRQMKIRDNEARYDLGQGLSMPAAIARHDLEQSRPRHLLDDTLLSSRLLIGKRTDAPKAKSFQLNAKLQISRNEESRAVKAFLDTAADITVISDKFMKSLPGATKAQREPADIDPHTADGGLMSIIARSNIYIAWDGTDFKNLVV
jgi:hypothetical protein